MLSCGSRCECVRTCVSQPAGVARIFYICLYSACVRACATQCALVMAVILKCSTFLAVISE